MTLRTWQGAFAPRAALALVCLTFVGCIAAAPTQEEGEPQVWVAEEATNSQWVLRASRSYRGPTRWQDAEQSFATPQAFPLPAFVPVTVGSAGNHKLELWYQEAGGVLVNCDYRGGSSEPHPTSALEQARGRRYVFERCQSGAKPGDVLQVTQLRLHVRVGDQKHPSERTEVELRVGGSPELEPPLSEEDIVTLRESFSWQQTRALTETTAEGHPTLYYALIYVEDREQVEALDTLLIHHDALPLLGSELERWSGQRGFFRHPGGTAGTFRFAFIPGRIYNLLREAALEGNVVFQAIVLRELPEALRDVDGSVSYQALREAGFLYRDVNAPAPDAGTPGTGAGAVGTQRQELFGSIVRGIIKGIAEVAEDVVDGVRTGIGWLDREVNGSVALSVHLDVRNTDMAFGFDTPMQRAWGAGAGGQVQLPGVRVTARQLDILIGFAAISRGTTGADGTARMRVAKNRKASLCVAVENDAAEVSDFLTEIEFCDFPAPRTQADTHVELKVRHHLFNILAQATEGRAYLEQVVGYSPHKASILVGALAEPWGVASKGIAPCFGLPNLLASTAVDVASGLLAGVIGSVGGPVAAAQFLAGKNVWAGVDIVLDDGDPLFPEPKTGLPPFAYDFTLDSRLVPTHEYGHFALCSMLYAENPATYAAAYTGAMLSRMDPEPDPDDEAGYINEGFADFFASQVAGGTNYFQSQGDSILRPDSNSHVNAHYCVAADSCLEANAGEDTGPSDPFDDQVARVAATLHDAFDDWAGAGDVPGAGNPWRTTDGGLPFVFVGAHAGPADERVRLVGNQVRRLIHALDVNGTWLNESNFMGGLSDMAEEAGHSWCERCELFAPTHTDAVDGGYTFPLDTADEESAICLASPVRDWIGPKPAGTLPCGTAGVSGTVLRAGAPVAGAQVRLEDTAGNLVEATTSDASGHFQLAATPGTSYDVRAAIVLEDIEYRGVARVYVHDGVDNPVQVALVSSARGRRVLLEGTLTIRNDESGGDDIISVRHIVEEALLDPDHPTHRRLQQPCDDGEEVRVDMYFDFSLPQEGTDVDVFGYLRLFEGTSCGTNDLEDERVYTLKVPTDGEASHSVRLENDEVGGGDVVTFDFTVRNEPLR